MIAFITELDPQNVGEKNRNPAAAHTRIRAGQGLHGRVIAVRIKHFLITLFERVFFTNRAVNRELSCCVFEFNACLAISLKLNGIFIQSEIELKYTLQLAQWPPPGLIQASRLWFLKVNISIMDIFNSCGNLKVEMFILLSSRYPLKLASRASTFSSYCVQKEH